MSADPKALYQEVILDHNRKPRNYGRLDHASHQAEGVNPLCGDHIHVEMDVADDLVRGIVFRGDSCAICKASASMMTLAVKGQRKEEARALARDFIDMATGRIEPESSERLRRLAVFAGIKNLPVRVKCAILPWHTLQAAFEAVPVTSTEAQADPMQAPLSDA